MNSQVDLQIQLDFDGALSGVEAAGLGGLSALLHCLLFLFDDAVDRGTMKIKCVGQLING